MTIEIIHGRDQVSARRAVARGRWLTDVARAKHLSDAQRRHCLDPQNLEAWWPNPYRRQEVA